MNGAREYHGGYAVAEVGDPGQACLVFNAKIRVQRKTAVRDLAEARERWPRNKLRVVRVSFFFGGRAAPSGSQAK